MTTAEAIAICCGDRPGDLRAATKKLYEHSREVDTMYAELVMFLATKTDVLAGLPHDLFARMEAFNNRMMRERQA